jgi:hypothetical protein
LRQTLLQAMQESPHAQPLVQTRQQEVGTGFCGSGLRRASAGAASRRPCNNTREKTAAALDLTKAHSAGPCEC